MNPITFQRTYRALRARADRNAAARMERVRSLTTAAGLDGSIAPCHLHNAFTGRQWEGVDYDLARLARHELAHVHDAHALVDQWAHRVYRTVHWGDCGTCAR